MPLLTTVAETEAYRSKARKVLSEAEREELLQTIAAHPDAGVVIQGTGGLRKLRIGLQGRGKRGGGRVIYWYHSLGYPAVLLWVFAKNEASDLTATQRKLLSEQAAGLLEDFGGKA